MKRLFSPPIQWILWLGSIACLGLATWNLLQLRVLDENQGRSTPVTVQIPESLMLTEPALVTYTKLVQAPLFWPLRAVPAPEVAVVETPAPAAPEEPPPPPLQAPTGRLVGIVDVGVKKYALIRNEEKNLSLYAGDQWDGWTVESITAQKLTLVAGEQKQEIKLIADFAAPSENQQLAQMRKKEEQKQQMAAARQQQAQQAAAGAGATPENLAIPPSLEPAAQAPAANAAEAQAVAAPSPVMSLKDALEARQRLMASRWGGNSNPAAGAGGQKAAAGTPAPTAKP